jgi:hypothetical protein
MKRSGYGRGDFVRRIDDSVICGRGGPPETLWFTDKSLWHAGSGSVGLGLTGDGSARICIQRDSYPDGSDFVGIGVLPDVADKATIAGLRRGQDEVLDEAVATLLK